MDVQISLMEGTGKSPRMLPTLYTSKKCRSASKWHAAVNLLITLYVDGLLCMKGIYFTDSVDVNWLVF